MKFSYNWLKELTGFKDTPEELAEFLTLRAFEVESIEKHAGDFTLDVKILPNRIPDASGHIGLAKEIAALKNLELKTKNDELKTAGRGRPAKEILQVKVEVAHDCPRYTARIINNIGIKPSPAWLKHRLEICGVQSINNVVDAANYVMLETGQPLHIFDYDRLAAKNKKTKTIIVRRAKKGEKIPALDGETYELKPEILVIADENEPIAIAGIKGGAHSGVSENTKTIILEAASFAPALIRKGSQLLNLKTDASYRFEHGLDPNLTEAAIGRLAELIIKIAGGEAAAGDIDEYPKKTMPRHLALRAEYVNRLAGTSFPPIMLEAALKRLGYNYQKRRTGEYHIETPTIRRDLEREEDLIEEIVRMWGYEKIPSTPPAIAMAATKEHEERFWERRIKSFFVGTGFTEVFRYIFTGEQEIKIFNINPNSLIEVVNPLAPEYRFLTNTPLASFVKATKENEAHSPAIRIFGITKSFSKATARASSLSRRKSGLINGVEEKKRLVLVWSEKSESSEEVFFRLKGSVDELFESLGLTEYWYDDEIEPKAENEEPRMFHPYRVAEIKIDNEKIGILGELHPVIRKTLKIKNVVTAAEIDSEKLIMLAEKEAEYAPVSRFPAIVRDVALVVPEEEKTETITNIIENAGGELLTDTDLFDYFQDEAMRGARKKSLAFHLVFQSKTRTLTDKEIDGLVKKIMAVLEKEGWVVRK